MAQYFYDSQIRRFLIQFARIFSDWNVTKGKDPAGNDIIVRVPIQYGDQSRQVAAIQANNSPSTLPSAPMITYYITGLEYDQKRTQDPYFIDKVNVRQRSFNQTTQSYEQTQGQAFTVERVMPVPYTLNITVDFWTSNYNQKLELVEQLGVLFNPSMEIQSTDNFIDWTSLSVVYQNGLTFSSRTVASTTGNPIDIMTWKFYMPIWLSTPTKVKKLGVVHKIIASIFQGNALTDMQDDHLLLGTREKITPYGYKLLLIGNTLQILPANQTLYPDNSAIDLPSNPNTALYWTSVLNVYGTVRPGISQIWLQNPYMDTDIVGTIEYNETDDRLLIFTIDKDTLPMNTIKSVDSIINPQLKAPGYGLPDPAAGQRYLIVEPIGSSKTSTIDNSIWGNVIASANDVIQYNGNAGVWEVDFDSNANTIVQYVTNITSGVQYRFANNTWMKSFEGWYDQGDYNIVI
jgi:hypothetical protein